MAQPESQSSSQDHPLGLTVYDLPSPTEVAKAEGHRTQKGRWLMWMVLLVCAAPVIASYVTYYVIRPQIQKSHGDLIQPTRAMPALQVTDLNQRPVDLSSLKKQWLLISVSSGRCVAHCPEHLYLQRQILTSLGRERDRLDWVWLISDDAPVPTDLAPGLKEAVVLRMGRADIEAWLQPASGQALEDHLFLVDPMGEWMMRFPAPIDRDHAPRIKRDLERLLRASAGWDQAGR
jgi:hypothetical protein